MPTYRPLAAAKHLLFIAAFFILIPAYSQKDFRPGYVVKNGDTLTGFVVYKTKGTETATFKPDKNGSVTNYDAASITAYGFDSDKRFESLDIDTTAGVRQGFALVLEKGAIDLYSRNNALILVKDEKLSIIARKLDSIVQGGTAKNPDSQGFVIRDSKYIAVLNVLVADCGGLNANGVAFSRGAISRLIENYNKCKNDVEPYKNKSPFIRFGATVAVGALTSSLEMDSLNGQKMKSGVTPLGEATVEIKFPRMLDKLAFNIGVQVIRLTHETSTTRTSTVQTITDDLKLTATLIKVPISIKYNFNTLWYARAGAWFGRPGNTSHTSFRTYASPAQTTTDNVRVGTGYRNPSGVLIATGVDFNLATRFRLFGEVRFEMGQGFTGNPVSVTSRIKTVGLLVGIGF